MNARAGGKAIAPALADFILLNEEIGALVRARLPLESHLKRMGFELPGAATDLADRLSRRMEAGESLAAAMDAECASLPAAYQAVIVAGVESGQLGSALESVVDTASRMDQLRRVTGVAILYPLMLVAVFCLLFAIVVSHVVPQFNWLNQSHFGPIAKLAEWPGAVAVAAFVVPSVVVLLTALWWWRSGHVAESRASQFGPSAWLPWMRSARRWGQAAALADMLRLLIERGLPLDRALTLAADATEDGPVRAAAHELAERARQGSFGQSPGSERGRDNLRAFPLLVRLALRHASDRRLLVGGLEQAAGIYRERAARAAAWYAEYIPILLTVAIGGTLTLAFALLIFWPYASTLRELAQWNWR